MLLKKLTNSYRHIYVVGISTILLSCNHYFDVSKKDSYPFTVNDFHCYADSNIFNYNSSTGLKSDTEVRTPPKVRVILPKEIIYYETFGATSFAYYFGQKQTVAILVNLNAYTTKDTMIILESDLQFEKLFPIYTFMGTNPVHNIQKIILQKSRISCIIVKGGNRLLLLNIKKRNFNKFRKIADSFYVYK